MLDLRPYIPGDNDWTTRSISPELAIELASQIAELTAWKTLGFTPEQLASTLTKTTSGQFGQVVLNNQQKPVAAFVVWPNWLFGPYLQLLAVLPPFQNQSVGTAILEAFEAHATQNQARNLWVVASSDNEPAQKLYRRHGFTAVTAIDGLVRDGHAEVLFRKRLVTNA